MLWSIMNYLTPTERMLLAVERGCVNSVHSLITEQAANPYSKWANGMTALHIAALNGHSDVCNYLIMELTENANNTRDKCEKISNQFLELHLKIQRLEYIVENRNKQQINEQNDEKHTALFLATLMGINHYNLPQTRNVTQEIKYNPVIKLLVEAGALVTEQDLNNCKERKNQEALMILQQSTLKNCQKCTASSKTCNKRKL